MTKEIEWGPEFRGSEEIGKVLKGEMGDTSSLYVDNWYNKLRDWFFDLSTLRYRLPSDHWFYKHPLFTGEQPFDPEKWLTEGRANKDKPPEGVALPEPVDLVLQVARENLAEHFPNLSAEILRGDWDDDDSLVLRLDAIRTYVELTRAQ